MEIDKDPAYQQMINGELYMESPILQERRRLVRREIMKYNQCADNDERNNGMKQLLRSVGDRFFVESTFEFSYGVNITIGNHFYANHGVTLCDEGLIKIGNDCKFGPKVGLYTPQHPLDPAIRRTEAERTAPITIGNDVWIGGGASILPGVTLGNNVIVGAGSVVTHSFPDNVIVVGNPARVLKTNEPSAAVDK
ncbi:sugar O-acetyltransferase [Lactiplantibacillus mudanjiangensis]|uniref:Maltose O-acetyltransferase [Lactobacillus plantarum JDM1] n=1 Tax=Lactiplantibacillus mudanjiangensis TaxID=1296538 RepID=A0A660DUW5_9LACO|nr:sugar O-acetyltransferase [Lactiplantibacillus mudanjiangensis]VDG26224.1 maltose O-acetyltransferase [Lactobacillus plantarum JDM1] [Lactiplantibacillus mudanjiangensis]VDG27383.1 maltose O-acetyltransferase [Lactobacillus plantarum JDM1] [Lactiplantibacillus mudanjiangensis]VDG33463.1 maltose O-acetyltransferase [Lactobacillus plantarum JDM1] [Lactiplantibacillus mudanjiangensis]